MAVKWTLFFMFLITPLQSVLSVDNKTVYIDLMKNYNKQVRPVKKTSDVVQVSFGIALNELENLDEKNQILILRITIRQSWIDPNLKWDPSLYDGVDVIHIIPSDIWIPDIVLYNNAAFGFGEGMTRARALVHNDGLVVMNVPAQIKSSCVINVDNYPFDKQECPLKFGSWSYDSGRISLEIESSQADLSNYISSGEWDLKEMNGVRNSVKYDCCLFPFHDITYTIKMERMSLFHAMYLIIPCTMISLLTLLVFLLPTGYSERMTLGMAILVGLSFFFLLVAENMPATSKSVPLVGVYYTVTMMEVSVAFFMTCWVLRYHHHNTTDGPMPKWIKTYILGYLAKGLGMCNKKEKEIELDEQEFGSFQNKPTVLANPMIEDEKAFRLQNIGRKDTNEILMEKVREESLLEKRKEEWRKAAHVINNFFMLVFFLMLLITVAAIFLQVPAG